MEFQVISKVKWSANSALNVAKRPCGHHGAGRAGLVEGHPAEPEHRANVECRERERRRQDQREADDGDA